MPVEVRELIIKATVSPEGDTGSPASSKAGSSGGGSEEIIRVCVEKILEIIKEKHGR
ncbi:MAG: DUF5908 family protein [Ginsengibacter sp.]